MIPYFLIIFFTLFAIKYESDDATNAFKGHKPRALDTNKKILQKIEGLVSYDQKTIKWRRAFVVSVIIAFLIPLILYQRFPTSKELLIITAISYVIFILQWNNYIENTSVPVAKYTRYHLNKLKYRIDNINGLWL